MCVAEQHCFFIVVHLALVDAIGWCRQMFCDMLIDMKENASSLVARGWAAGSPDQLGHGHMAAVVNHFMIFQMRLLLMHVASDQKRLHTRLPFNDTTLFFNFPCLVMLSLTFDQENSDFALADMDCQSSWGSTMSCCPSASANKLRQTRDQSQVSHLIRC